MNNSGIALKNYMDYYGITSKEIIIIHDDIDLAFGRIKIKEKGGYGGHKGVKSIMDKIGGTFTRLRIGIGRSLEQPIIVRHVLENFSTIEQKELVVIIENAREIVTAIINHGTKYCMNQFNSKQTVL
jgi:PTH1 family peptidyl-tRNA hydrolase